MSVEYKKYKNFREFCTKNRMTPEEGLDFLNKELERLRLEAL